MSRPGCEAVRPLLPDVAVGVADGDDRAAVLAHVEACATCRAELDVLGSTADELLLLVPPAEPPAGFEAAVMARLSATPAPAPPPDLAAHRRPTRRLVAAGVALAAAAAVVLGLWVSGADDPATIDGDLVADGEVVGSVAATPGDPARLEVTVDGLPDGLYTVHCGYSTSDESHSYYALDAGTLRVAGGQAEWDVSVAVDVSELTKVSLLLPNDDAAAVARVG